MICLLATELSARKGFSNSFTSPGFFFRLLLVCFSVQDCIIELLLIYFSFLECEDVGNRFDQVLKFGGNIEICGRNSTQRGML